MKNKNAVAFLFAKAERPCLSGLGKLENKIVVVVVLHFQTPKCEGSARTQR